jgi:hypothetical protein
MRCSINSDGVSVKLGGSTSFFYGFYVNLMLREGLPFWSGIDVLMVPYAKSRCGHF